MTPTATETKTQQAKPPSPQPIKPRPVLFVVLCAVFAVWMAILAALYILTVWPVRHP
jgi:uncharacterized protein involved in exopolysaccharide biosynthesis